MARVSSSAGSPVGRERATTPRPFSRGSAGECVVQALVARGIAYRYLRPDEITNPELRGRTIAEFCVNNATYYIGGGCLRVSDPRGICVPGNWGLDGPTAPIARKKYLIKSFLRTRGIKVPDGTVFFFDAMREAESYFATLSSALSDGVCVKPGNGKWGNQVHVGIRDSETFRAAFAAVAQHYKRVIVEETVPGPVYRFTCIGGRVIAIEIGRPANVEGDGIHTIAELVELKNEERRVHPTHSSPLTLGQPQREFLRDNSFQLDDAPERGKLVFLSSLSNWHQGGEFIDVTDGVHQSYVEVVERVLNVLPDLVFCGVDIAIPDIAQPAGSVNYNVLELNCCPGFSTSHYPWRGQSRDVAGAIIDYLTTIKPITKRREVSPPKKAPRAFMAALTGRTRPGRDTHLTASSFSRGGSGDCLVQALAAREIPFNYLSPDEITHPLLARMTVASFKINGVQYYFDGGCLRVSDLAGIHVPGPLIDGLAAPFVKRKDLVKSFLRKHGVSVPQGAAFSRDAEREAESYFASLCQLSAGGVCVKPVDGKKGRLVHTGIRELSSFRTAFGAVANLHDRILIEETVRGQAYRYTYLAGSVIAVELGLPANVEGDGVHTISELVELKNAERRLNPGHAGRLLRLGKRARAFLGRANLGPDHVPRSGVRMFLSESSNMHQGGEFIDVTNTVHKSYTGVIERALSKLDGLVFCGADVIIENAHLEATEDNYHVLELNCGPGFSTNHYPWRGQSRDVAGHIIDFLAKTRRADKLRISNLI